MFSDNSFLSKKKNMVHSDPTISAVASGGDSCDTSPTTMSPWTGLIREEGHIYSLAVHNGFLYTGSDSSTIRIWKNMQQFSAFKSTSGLVKAIIISGHRIFTGHKDGKIRFWNITPQNAVVRVGTMPPFFDVLKASIKPSSYVEVKPNRRALRIKHNDAVSCLSMSQDKKLLYSASWDTTFKVWNLETSKCVDSVNAHDDAVNAIVCSADGMVYTGSADGTVKVWRREGKRHVRQQTLRRQECAVTALAVTASGSVVYCGSSDGLVNLWEVEKQVWLHGGVLKGHVLAVLCLAAAGSLVFSGSADRTICVWRREAAVHTCLTVLSGHTGPVKCLAVEEDKESAGGGRKWKVYSGSLDKSVKVWSVSETTPDLNQMDLMQNRDGNYSSWELFT